MGGEPLKRLYSSILTLLLIALLCGRTWPGPLHCPNWCTPCPRVSWSEPVRSTTGAPLSTSAQPYGACWFCSPCSISLGRGPGRVGSLNYAQALAAGSLLCPAILLLLSLLHLPLAILGHHISLSYGQSIQGWGSWFFDWSKALMLDLVSGTVVLSVLFALIRNSPPLVALVMARVAAHAASGRLRAAAGSRPHVQSL